MGNKVSVVRKPPGLWSAGDRFGATLILITHLKMCVPLFCFLIQKLGIILLGPDLDDIYLDLPIVLFHLFISCLDLRPSLWDHCSFFLKYVL